MATLFLTTDAPGGFGTVGTPVNVGMAFFVSTAATAVAIRFYKSPSDPSTAHTVSLWDVATHTLLAQATSSGETSSGWQEVALSPPVNLTANQAYRVSTFTSDASSNGYYGYTTNYFTAPVTQGIITGYQTGTVPPAGEPNCTYDFNSTADYPTGDSSGGNYWVDIKISDPGGTTQKITASIAIGRAGQNIAPSGIAPSVSFGNPVLAGGGGGLQKTSVNLFIGRTTAQGIAPLGIGPTAGFGLPALTPGGVTLQAQGLGPTATVGLPGLSGGVTNPVFISTTLVVGRALLTVQPIGIGPTSSVGNPGVFQGNRVFVTASFNVGLTVGQPVQPLGIGPGTQVGLPAISPGSVNIAVTGIASTSAIGLPGVILGGAVIAPLAIQATVSFGLPTLTPGAAGISPLGIPSGVSVGNGLILANTNNINALGIAPTVSLGSPIVTLGDLIIPAGINPTTSIGFPRVYLGLVVLPIGIGPGSSVGTPSLQYDQFLTAVGIGPTAQVGLPFIYEVSFIPPEDGPELMPPYAGQEQEELISVTADIAWRESQMEEGPWVIPPYSAIFPPEPDKIDLWAMMQEWP